MGDITNRLRALLGAQLAGDAALSAALTKFAVVADDVENARGPYHHLQSRLKRLRLAAQELLPAVPAECDDARLLLEGICLAGGLA